MASFSLNGLLPDLHLETVVFQYFLYKFSKNTEENYSKDAVVFPYSMALIASINAKPYSI